MSEVKKIIIAGGGTGGHIFPAVAIAHAIKIKWPDSELLFVGAKGKMEMEKIPKEGFNIIGLDIAGFNRSNFWKNILLPFKLIKSRIQANKIIKEFKPNAVIGVGGYASFPMMYAAQAKQIPTIIQEQNSFAGKSNKILGKKASLICVAYEGMEKFFPKSKIFKSGNPVRSSISRSEIKQGDAKEFFGLDSTKKTILVIGGSLGAKSINEAVFKHIEELLQMNVQVIWQTGKHFISQANEIKALHEELGAVQEFIPKMEYAYAAADVIISRAGALASAELCIVGKPVIFVPYPYAAEDHQTSNALALVNKNAALMIKDNEIEHKLNTILSNLLRDEKLQKELGRNIKTMAVPDADSRIVSQIAHIIE